MGVPTPPPPPGELRRQKGRKKSCWELLALTWQRNLPDPCRASIFSEKVMLGPILTRNNFAFQGNA